jgi:hypothetical protein
MRKTMLFAAVLLLTTVSSRTARAKDHSKESSAATEQSDAYRLNISFNELEDGKKLNTRHYSVDLTGGRPKEIKIGTRVPVVSANCGSSSSGSASDQYQYLDVGTHIWAQLISRSDELHITGDISSLDTTAGTEGSTRLGPVIRQIKIEGSTAVVLGKPLIVGSADDPNSKREYQIEVTVTKLR